MRLNKKGYMLVEIIVAAVIAFSIAYYLLNLTFKFKDKNELVHDSRDLNSIKINVTKNIMNDLDGKNIEFKLEGGKVKGISENNDSIEFYANGSPRKLIIVNDNNNNKKEIKYGYHTNGTIKMTKLSNDPYYVKNLSSYNYLNIDNITIEEEVKNDEIVVSIDIPISSIYTDEVTHIKLLLHGQEYEESNHRYFVAGVAGGSYNFNELLSNIADGGQYTVCSSINADGSCDEEDSGSIVFPGKYDGSSSTINISNKNIIFNSPLQIKEDSDVTFKGNGTISFSSNIVDDSDLIDNQGKLVLNGVSIGDNNGVTGNFINNSGDAVLEIGEGTNILSNATSGTIVSGGNIFIKGANISSKSNCRAIVSNESITMDGGVINVENAVGIWAKGELTINGGIINKKVNSGKSIGAAVVYRGTETANIEKVTINVVNAGSNAIYNGDVGTINIKDVIASNDTYRCVTNNSNGIINVDGTRYTCKDFAFTNNSSGTINIYSGAITTDGSTSNSKIFKNVSGVINDKR